MKISGKALKALFLLVVCLGMGACWSPQLGASEEAGPPRYSLFIGMDISGSFLQSKNFEDSLDFLAHYIHAHLKGYGGLDVPFALFVGSIGGVKPDEPKTLYPIQTFENESIDGIRKKLGEIFPKTKANPFTDFNAFFEQIENTVKNRKLVLKPISIVLISDGVPDVPKVQGETGFKKIHLKPLEMLSRNVTLRLLYTDAVTGMNWQKEIPRKRVKIWTQDAAVMAQWKDPKILLPGKPFDQQGVFFNWIKDNVDFNVRAQRVD